MIEDRLEEFRKGYNLTLNALGKIQESQKKLDNVTVIVAKVVEKMSKFEIKMGGSEIMALLSAILEIRDVMVDQLNALKLISEDVVKMSNKE